MKRNIIILFLFIMGVTMYAQDRYASRMTPDGTIYFIMPKKLGKLHGIKHFDYDMTLLSWTDSVTVNFTFVSNTLGLPSDLSIKCGEQIFRCNNYSLLFQDIKKKSFEIRVTSKFPISEIEHMIHNINPPIFIFAQGDQKETATYSDAAWLKERKKLIDIYQIYLYSKSK